jgi:cell division septum initiation protein DivIVA
LSLEEFRVEERRLRRDYADVLARAEASPHADLMEQMLSTAKAELRSARRQKRTE